MNDLFKLIGVIVFTILIIYLLINSFRLQVSVIEGLTNANVSGEAGSASNYSANIKSQVVKLQDELLISKYRKDYENVIIEMDDLIGYNMLKLILNMKTDTKEGLINSLNNLNTLKNAKESLNNTMKFLDSK